MHLLSEVAFGGALLHRLSRIVNKQGITPAEYMII